MCGDLIIMQGNQIYNDEPFQDGKQELLKLLTHHLLVLFNKKK